MFNCFRHQSLISNELSLMRDTKTENNTKHVYSRKRHYHSSDGYSHYKIYTSSVHETHEIDELPGSIREILSKALGDFIEKTEKQ